MFGRGHFGRGHFGSGFFGTGGGDAPPSGNPAAIWAYVLPNGKTAGQNLAEVNDILTGPLLAGLTLTEILSILTAVAAGKSSVAASGGGAAHVEFRSIDDAKTVVAADMQGSARVDVDIDP